MISIENETLKISIASRGAEPQSIIDKTTGQQYMWSADPSYWGKCSPILFPIVGVLKENSYYYKEQKYTLPRHGFAREMEFALAEQTEGAVSYLLENNEATLQSYPFPFKLYVDYSLVQSTLNVTYRVVNIGTDTMYFSIGGHPAFKLPLFEGDEYTDYILRFEKTENTGRWLLDNGLIGTDTEPFLENTDTLVLDKSLFESDAVVLKSLNSSKVRLLSSKTRKGFQFDFSGFPYLGIWAAKGANFVCIEPWCGIADSVEASQQLTEKEGINKLAVGQEFIRTWRVDIVG